jgi:hypothetical protein
MQGYPGLFLAYSFSQYLLAFLLVLVIALQLALGYALLVKNKKRRKKEWQKPKVSAPKSA